MDIAAARGVHSPDGCTDAYARAAGDTLLPYIDRLGGVQDEGGFSGVVCRDRGGPARLRSAKSLKSVLDSRPSAWLMSVIEWSDIVGADDVR